MRNDPLTREEPPRVYQEEMGNGPLSGLSPEQVDHIRPLFPKERGVKRVDDRKVLSGIIPVIHEGAALGGCPAADGPHTTFYNRCRHW